MTVLKSFELKGNKQSFANWISNLSPCNTPFISMISKEGIDEAQYSWQMDALDRPKSEGVEEGSEFVAENREGTHVLHNFTSILRKVANVSDTATKIGTYGRNSEMAYQMEKAGKELKRDMEFMCLHNDEGNIGTSTLASNFSGFTPLCAPKGYVDFATGAVTFKEVKVANVAGPWFKTSDLFDLTYNLFLAGSKANKIMYHPRHATTFSDFIGHSFEARQTFRMFDNVDTKFNLQVNKIRDPLGQNYDLISNRYMPENKIYIFNEADWTQMILRAPSATKLAKQGSSERFMLETEIGLRHRHINASGVMDMLPSTLKMEWTEEPSPLTWGVNHNEEAEITITTRATGAPIAAGTVVTWTTSNPIVLDITDTTGHTDALGKATNVLKPKKAGTSIVSAICGDSRASYIVTVKDPDIRLRLSNNLVEKDQKFLVIVQVLKADGNPVEDGIVVKFKADPSTLVTFDSIQAVTTGASGTAQVEVTAGKTTGLVQFQASVSDAVSNYARLDIVDKVEQLALSIPQRVLAFDVNDKSIIQVTMTNAAGVGIQGKSVGIASTDPDVITISTATLTTGPNGDASLVLTAKGIGTTQIVASYDKQEVGFNVTVSAPAIVMVQPQTGAVGQVMDLAATVSRSDDSKVGNVQVKFTSDPAFTPEIPESTTGSDGIARATYTPTSNTDLEITATVGNYASAPVTVSVAMAP